MQLYHRKVADFMIQVWHVALFSEQWRVMTINRQAAAGTSVPLSTMDTDITERQKLTDHFLSLCDFYELKNINFWHMFISVTHQIFQVTRVWNMLLK